MGTLQRRRDHTRVLLSAEHVVGRLPICHLALDAAFISTAHALVRWTGQSWELRDLGSKNGTYVDGQRIPVGASVSLLTGVEIVFGETTETWRFVDDWPPRVAAVPLDGGPPTFFASGAVAVPSEAEPLAIIYAEEDCWWLEVEDTRMPLQHGQRFSVAGREWRFDCPAGSRATHASAAQLKKLVEVTLVFDVSSDEEHVGLKVKSGDATQDLGERGCFYLALVLFRQRIKERRAGVGDPGWIALERLLRMVPEYTSCSHLNVDICRLRQLLFDTGVQDAVTIIDRRRGQIRFGLDRAELHKDGMLEVCE
jgi:hypothetical protein